MRRNSEKPGHNRQGFYKGEVVHGKYEVLKEFTPDFYLIRDVKTDYQYKVGFTQLFKNKVVCTEKRIKTAYPHLKSLWA